MSLPILTVRIQYEHDVVAARQRTRQIAVALGFESQQQTRIATAVSEIARNAFTYGSGGKVEFSLDGATAPQLLSIRIADSGKGIPHLEEILEGRYRSETGMGLGIIGAKRLMDRFAINSTPGKGTEVILGKLLPRRAPLVSPEMLPRLIAELEKQKPRDILDEFRDQNRELMRTLDELRRRQEELLDLNRELEDTNRGVVALYAELDERAANLRRADELKSRFLSHMSHEFRTPLNSILALSRLLAERTDGDLTPDQEIQVGFIRKSAESLFELVNDLLDLAKVEAGKIEIRPVEFDVNTLFSALRGMMRPLLVTSAVSLVFDDADSIPPVYSDEGKVSQILRNFISNALKFTEAGEVRVSASHDAEKNTVRFTVRDTGIGIAPEDRETIFEEFMQLDSPLQRKLRGTGLGLPLSRKLAELLGGSVGVESEPGAGSCFYVSFPLFYREAEPAIAGAETPGLAPEGKRAPILLVDDHYETRLLYTRYLADSPWYAISARSVHEAENVLRNVRPVAILLDIPLDGEDFWHLLAHLKSHRETKSIPVIVATLVDDRAKALALGADVYALKPLSQDALLSALRALTGHGRKTVLVIDDEAISRYLIKQLLSGWDLRTMEAADGRQGIEMALAETPDLIVLDINMPVMNGFQVLDKIESDPNLRGIPVIVSTSKVLTAEETARLARRVIGMLPKESLSHSGVAARIGSLLKLAGFANTLDETHPQAKEARAWSGQSR